MNAYPNISAVASLVADPSRAIFLEALLDGRALPAGELAYMAGVTPKRQAVISRSWSKAGCSSLNSKGDIDTIDSQAKRLLF